LEWARVAGVMTGLMTSFTETAQIGVAAAPVKAGLKEAGESLFQVYAKELVKRFVEETSLEMGQETSEMLIQDFATLMSNQFADTDLNFNSFQDYVNQNWETFKFMALGGGAVVTAGPTISLPRDITGSRRARQIEAVAAEASICMVDINNSLLVK